MKIEAGQHSLQGRRDGNQDACGVIEGTRGIVAVVCDGLGGHVGGAEAAEAAVDAVRQATLGWTGRAPNAGEVARYLVAVAETAVRALHKDPRLDEAMTTIVLWVLAFDDPGACAIAHVGDSRAYLYRSGGLRPLTTDHALGRHTLAACLGSHGGPDSPDVKSLACGPGDTFLLCSDGLHGTLGDDEIGRGLRDRLLMSSDSVAATFCHWAFHEGSQDNITAVVLRLAP